MSVMVNAVMRAKERYKGIVRLVRNQDPAVCCPQETCFRFKDTNRLKKKNGKVVSCHHQEGWVLEDGGGEIVGGADPQGWGVMAAAEDVRMAGAGDEALKI